MPLHGVVYRRSRYREQARGFIGDAFCGHTFIHEPTCERVIVVDVGHDIPMRLPSLEGSSHLTEGCIRVRSAEALVS